MDFPSFYNPSKVGSLFVPDTARAIAAGRETALPPASQDSPRTMLLLVDAQVDFIHEDGALSVPGAVADTQRTIEWIFRNLPHLTSIAVSLDSHIPIQIFYPTWWVNAQGQHPTPYTAITTEDVNTGRWAPVYARDWSIEYVRKLEEQARKVLMIWPYHTMIGTVGQTITPALYEAIVYHSGARNSQPEFITKGFIERTEYYSILEPEVKVPEEADRGGLLNESFLGRLASYDLTYIAGQAKSHCVLETTRSIMRCFEGQPEMLGRLRLLEDCTSSVTHPDIDFETLANIQLANFTAQGLRIVRAADPIG